MLVPVAAVVPSVSFQHQEQQDLGSAEVQTQVVVAAGSSPRIAAWEQTLVIGNKRFVLTLLLLWRIHSILWISNIGDAVGEVRVVAFEVVIPLVATLVVVDVAYFFQLVTLPILDLILLVINEEVHMLLLAKKNLVQLVIQRFDLLPVFVIRVSCAFDGPIAVLVVITI